MYPIHNNKFTDQQIQDAIPGFTCILFQDSFSKSRFKGESTDIEMSAVNGVGRILQFWELSARDQRETREKQDLTVSDKEFASGNLTLTDISAKAH